MKMHPTESAAVLLLDVVGDLVVSTICSINTCAAIFHKKSFLWEASAWVNTLGYGKMYKQSIIAYCVGVSKYCNSLEILIHLGNIDITQDEDKVISKSPRK